MPFKILDNLAANIQTIIVGEPVIAITYTNLLFSIDGVSRPDLICPDADSLGREIANSVIPNDRLQSDLPRVESKLVTTRHYWTASEFQRKIIEGQE